MPKTIQVIFASLLTTVLFIETSMAGNILYGTIRSDKGESTNNLLNTRNYNQSCQHFPMSVYGFYPIMAYDLKYDDQVPQQDRVRDLSIFTLNPSANLVLLAFDKVTGLSKFKLKLTGGDWLHYTGRGRGEGPLFETGGTTLKGGGSLKLTNGSIPEFIIEGKFEHINGKAHWISFNHNPYFDIKVENFFNCKYEVSLIRLQNIPVIVST